MSRKFLATLALLALFAALFVTVTAQEAPKPEQPKETAKAPIDESKFTPEQKANVAVLDAVFAAIRRSFYDRQFAGKDLAEMRGRFVQRVVDSKPGEPLYALLRTLLGEFKVSHLTIIAPDVYQTNFAPEMNNSRSMRPGLDISELEPGKYFVGAVLDGSAAQTAGVLRGDRIVEIQGKPAAQSPLLADSGGDPGLPGLAHFFIRVPEGDEPLELKVQRKADAKELITLVITCTATSMIEATRKSVAVIEHQGRKFGYIHFWHFLSPVMSDTLRKALNKEFKDCDGMIVDLRGRGGNVQVMNTCFAPFGDPPPVQTRQGPRQQNYNMPKWTRPVIALQDSGSRSAKEVYAHNWKWLNIGPVVGESTPGAVLGSSFIAMPDGCQLLLPAQAVRGIAYGQTELEGNPVEPTHAVKDLLAYAGGVDVIKEAGIKVLHELVKDKPKVEPAPAAPKEGRKEEEFSVAPRQWHKAG